MLKCTKGAMSSNPLNDSLSCSAMTMLAFASASSKASIFSTHKLTKLSYLERTILWHGCTYTEHEHVFRVRTRNTEHGTRNTEHGTRNTEHGTRNTNDLIESHISNANDTFSSRFVCANVHLDSHLRYQKMHFQNEAPYLCGYFRKTSLRLTMVSWRMWLAFFMASSSRKTSRHLQ